MTELEHYIQSYFGVVNDEDLQLISSLFKLTTIKKGDYLVKSERRCDKMCFVESGLLRVFVTTEEKEKVFNEYAQQKWNKNSKDGY